MLNLKCNDSFCKKILVVKSKLLIQMKKRQNIRKLILLISFILYPVTFFIMSPDLLMFGASEKVMAGDVMFFGFLFIFSFVFGRLFCGWVCPAGALQDYSTDINKKPAKNKWNWIKMALFIPWIIFFAFLIIHEGGFNQADFFYKRAFGISLAGTAEWTMYFMTAAIVFIMAVLCGKRGFCHYLCWVSPFMIISGKIRDSLKIPSLRLITRPELCNSCGLCSRVCPMSLPLDELVKNSEISHLECTLCSTCVDKCPKGALKFAFRSKPDIKK
jgi:ferredoxin-type protein NapH